MHIDFLGLDKENLEWFQMFTRTLIVFLVAIIFIRVAGMRTFGTKTAFDVVVSITLGAVLSRCITGHYPFFPTLGSALLLALIHRVFAWLCYKSSFLRRMIEGEAILLYHNEKKIKANLARQCITEQDLSKALHEENLDGFEKVKEIWLEPDGKISIVKGKKE